MTERRSRLERCPDCGDLLIGYTEGEGHGCR